MINLHKIFEKLFNNKFLTKKESFVFFESVFNKDLDFNQISSFLTLLKHNGETFENIIGLVDALKKRAKKIKISKELIDTCGTGGDNKGSYNISTATAILSATCNLKVAKHGNRSVTSKSGSSDLLESLGININLSEEEQKRYFRKNNICFLFAPIYHKSIKEVMEVRNSLPFRTIFNLVGPLLNPTDLDYQLLGVGDKKNLQTHSVFLKQSKIKTGWVVHNINGFDELTTTGTNLIYKIKNNKISKLTKLCPRDIGFKISNQSDLKGGTPKENAYITHRLFEGETGAIRDSVVLNTAACLLISNKVKSLKDGKLLAEKNIDNFSAKKKLEELKI